MFSSTDVGQTAPVMHQGTTLNCGTIYLFSFTVWETGERRLTFIIIEQSRGIFGQDGLQLGDDL